MYIKKIITIKEKLCQSVICMKIIYLIFLEVRIYVNQIINYIISNNFGKPNYYHIIIKKIIFSAFQFVNNQVIEYTDFVIETYFSREIQEWLSI